MTVGSVMAEIRELEDMAECLRNYTTSLSEASVEEKNQLIIKYGIREDVLFNAARLLEITAADITEDLNKCEVDMKL